MRDGVHIVGTLRSFDQYSNIVLEDAVERRNVGNKAVDVPLGLFVLRSESIVLLGSVSEAKEKSALEFVSMEQLKELEEKHKDQVEKAKLDWNFDRW